MHEDRDDFDIFEFFVETDVAVVPVISRLRSDFRAWGQERQALRRGKISNGPGV